MIRTRCCLAATLAASLAPFTLIACGGSSSHTSSSPPPDTSALAAVHENGQSFITWLEREDLDAESYRIYRSASAFGDSVPTTPPLYADPLSEGSGEFSSDRIHASTGWRPRYIERFVVPDGDGTARMLGEEEGLLVWTLAAEDFSDPGSCPDFIAGEEGCAYYAVTLVAHGVETLQATFGPVHERVAPPRAIEVTAFVDPALHVPEQGEHVFTQFMDLRAWNPTLHAPNPFNEYWGFPPDRGPQLAYAYSYVVFEPGPDCHCDEEGPQPVVVYLHGLGGWRRLTEDKFPGWCAWRVHPIDTGDSWWFGFAKSHDYRGGMNLNGLEDEVIENFTEQRILRTVLDLPATLGEDACDLDRVYVVGYSMGAGGALSMAMRYPNVFAAGYAAKPITRYAEASLYLTTSMRLNWGRTEENFGIELDAPEGLAEPLAEHQGTPIWEWMDHTLQAQLRAGETMAPFGVITGLNDSMMPWDVQSLPAYEAFEDSGLVWSAATHLDGHTWNLEDDPFGGLSPSLGPGSACGSDEDQPFFGFRVTRGESLPAISLPTGTQPDWMNVNVEVEWSASWNPWDGVPLDLEDEWRISLRSTREGGSFVDVTPRRAQAFVVEPGASYREECRAVSDDSLLCEAMIQATDHGVLLAPDVWVPSEQDPRSGIRLCLTRYRLSESPTDGLSVTGGTPFAVQELWVTRPGDGAATLVTRSVADGEGRADFFGAFDGGAWQVREEGGQHRTNDWSAPGR